MQIRIRLLTLMLIRIRLSLWCGSRSCSSSEWYESSTTSLQTLQGSIASLHSSRHFTLFWFYSGSGYGVLLWRGSISGYQIWCGSGSAQETEDLGRGINRTGTLQICLRYIYLFSNGQGCADKHNGHCIGCSLLQSGAVFRSFECFFNYLDDDLFLHYAAGSFGNDDKSENKSCVTEGQKSRNFFKGFYCAGGWGGGGGGYIGKASPSTIASTVRYTLHSWAKTTLALTIHFVELNSWAVTIVSMYDHRFVW